MDVGELLKYIDINRDGKINYTEWTRALTPKNKEYKAIMGKRALNNLEKDENQIRTDSWQGELRNLLAIYAKAENFNEQLKMATQVNGNEIFDKVDR